MARTSWLTAAPTQVPTESRVGAVAQRGLARVLRAQTGRPIQRRVGVPAAGTGVTGRVLRGDTVSAAWLPPSTPPSVSSMVALRSALVNTSRLVLPRTALTRLQP